MSADRHDGVRHTLESSAHATSTDSPTVNQNPHPHGNRDRLENTRSAIFLSLPLISAVPSATRFSVVAAELFGGWLKLVGEYTQKNNLLDRNSKIKSWNIYFFL